MKETEIRPKELFHKYLELSAADTETYFISSQRNDLPCPACGNQTSQPAFEKSGFGYTVCRSCQTLYQNPRPPLEEFSRFYQESPSARYWAKEFFPAIAEIRREKLFKPKVMELARLCQNENFKPAVVADVGAGFGLFLEEWRNLFPDTRTIAIEPNPEMADLCREKKLEVIECFAEQASSLYGHVDLLVALEVIEHVHDPLVFCNSLNHLLCAGGRLLLTGLSIDGFDTQVLWEHAKSISPPHHINFMSILGFERLLSRAGFSNICVFTPGKLDVDIVNGAVAENPDVLKNNRFVRHLLGRNDSTLKKFQEFLSEHQLSSHCWVWASK
jgi:SAM-dependent methyltransferase